MQGCFPFAEVVGGDHNSFFDGDLSESGDEEFASDNHCGDPCWAEALSGENDKGGSHEDFVGEWVEEFAKGGDKIEFSSEISV